MGYLLACLAAGQTCVCRQQLVARLVVFQHIKDVLCHVQLVGELKYLRLRLVLLLQVEVAGLFEVGDMVACLEGGDAVIHLVERFLYHQETLIDETCRVSCHLFFLVDPPFVIDLYDGVEHPLCTLG